MLATSCGGETTPCLGGLHTRSFLLCLTSKRPEAEADKRAVVCDGYVFELIALTWRNAPDVDSCSSKENPPAAQITPNLKTGLKLIKYHQRMST